MALNPRGAATPTSIGTRRETAGSASSGQLRPPQGCAKATITILVGMFFLLFSNCCTAAMVFDKMCMSAALTIRSTMIRFLCYVCDAVFYLVHLSPEISAK